MPSLHFLAFETKLSSQASKRRDDYLVTLHWVKPLYAVICMSQLWVNSQPPAAMLSSLGNTDLFF